MGCPSGFEDEMPYAVAVVKLDEGVQLLARLHPDQQGGWDGYRCDDPVTFVPGAATESLRQGSVWFAKNPAIDGGTTR
jgi:uncharacterized OB-fold protein